MELYEALSKALGTDKVKQAVEEWNQLKIDRCEHDWTFDDEMLLCDNCGSWADDILSDAEYTKLYDQMLYIASARAEEVAERGYE